MSVASSWLHLVTGERWSSCDEGDCGLDKAEWTIDRTKKDYGLDKAEWTLDQANWNGLLARQIGKDYGIDWLECRKAPAKEKRAFH